MLIPIRCFTCGKITGNKYEKYCSMVANGMTAKEALTKLGLHRICCRRIIFNHCNQIDKMLDYEASKPIIQDTSVEYIQRPLKRTKPNYCIAR